MRIAILEDDPDQLALLKHWLTTSGYDVHGFLSGRAILTQAGRESYDVFILDWQVPDIPGPEVLVWIRKNVSKTVPILFVTVRDSEDDIVFALEKGADDYMIKPLRRQELLARTNALVRRAFPNEEKALLDFPPFRIAVDRREISRLEIRVELRPKEFDLAVALFRNIGRLLSRGHLQELVWGKAIQTTTRTVDTHVSQVRRKLQLGPDSGFQVVPVYHYGYRLERL